MRGVLLCLLALLVSAAGAQTAELQPSPAQACLRHVGGEDQEPAYPIADYNMGRAGRVQVMLEFSRGDRAPEVNVLLQEGGEAFADAVRQHARGLRVPCLIEGSAPVRLGKDFVFSPGTPQARSSAAQDPEQQRRKAMLACVVHAKGWRVPEYPRWARREGVQGRVLVRARYASATEPPQLDVFARPYAGRLADEIKEWMQDTRLPCHTGEPLTAVWTYIYVFEGDRYGFNAVSFRQFLGSVKGITEQTLQLDTGTMDCPFDVELQYRQPHLPNAVRDIGPHHAARQPLLRWMAASELALPRNSVDAIWGDTARITIPCLKIDLKPKEKS